MIWFYRILFIPLLLVLLPRQLARMRKRGGYQHDWQQRFGKLGPVPEKQTARVWIQAVSVGELNAIDPLLRLLQKANIEVALSTTTSTGYALALEKYTKFCVKIFQFPVDFHPFSTSVWRQIQPDCIVLMESELWPEHLHRATRAQVPVILANARLSDGSFRRYRKHRWLAHWLFNQLSCVLASSSEAMERFLALGVPAERLRHTGNIKFDVDVQPLLNDKQRAELRAEMGFAESSLILLGSSTWPGEEKMLLETQKNLIDSGCETSLLIVPRHAERKEEIRNLLKGQPLPYHFRSQKNQAPAGTSIYVADTTGELTMLSQVANLAFIGKSLPPNEGGQTPIEAAALGLPICYGPQMSNFREICRSLESTGAAIRVKDADGCQHILLELAKDDAWRAEIAANARQWHRNNRGACSQTLTHICEQLAIKTSRH